MNQPSLLVVDDEASVRASIRLVFDMDFRVAESASAQEAIRYVQAEKPDVILLDILLPGTDGLEVLKQVKTMHPEGQVIMLTGLNTARSAFSSRELGAFDYVTKPFDVEEMRLRVNRALETVRLTRELDRTGKTLAQQTQELARSNAELEEFAYVASHDLQEPLRKIQAFGDRLKGKCGAELGNQGRDYLERMQKAAERMQNLINGLLTLSKVTSKANPFALVNLADTADEVISDLQLRIEQVGGRVEIRDLPTIEADPVQMRQLLQNLIANGLKFHKEGEQPWVRVYAQRLSGETPVDELCQIIVEDNGIGFNQKYSDRIFIGFERLHGRGEYEGTGIGLALCRKIAERHGGHISARSTPGQGSTFIATLPVSQPI